LEILNEKITVYKHHFYQKKPRFVLDRKADLEDKTLKKKNKRTSILVDEQKLREEEEEKLRLGLENHNSTRNRDKYSKNPHSLT
jgi:hypothetical protein